MMHQGIIGLISPFISNNLFIILTAIYYNSATLIIIFETILFIIFRCYKFDITNANYKLFTDTTSIYTRLSPHNDKIGLIISFKFRYIGYIYNNNDNAKQVSTYSGFIYSTYNSSNSIQDYVDSINKKGYLIYNTTLLSDNRIELERISQPIEEFDICELTHQKKVADFIFRGYSKKRSRVYSIVLYGKPGLGKSLTAHLTANTLVKHKQVNFITGYTLNHPKVGIRELYSSIINLFGVNIQKNNIVNIILLDEIDIALTRIHNDTINPPIPQQTAIDGVKYAIKNKEDYNSMMDAITLGIYPNIILIMTTNKSRDYFDSMDPSYLRYGRIDAHINYNTMKCVEKTRTMRKTCEYDNIE